MIQVLRPGSMSLIAIIGYDVLLDLTTNTQMINHADKSIITIEEVIDHIRGRGIAQVFTDFNPLQTGEVTAARSYKGSLDGVFYLGTEGNLIRP